MIGGAAELLDERSVPALRVRATPTATIAAGGRPMRKGFMFLTGTTPRSAPSVRVPPSRGGATRG